MSIALLMQQLRDAGAPVEAIMIAVAAVEAERSRFEAAEVARKASQRERTAKHRAASRDSNVTVTPLQRDPPPKENNQTPHPQTSPTDPDGSVPRRGSRRPKSILCPDDFQPSQSHFDKAAEQGQGRDFVIATRDRMHRWSHANANRPVARKSDWGMAFHSFLDRALAEAPSPHARQGPASPRPASAQQRAFDIARQADRALNGDPDDPGPFHDDATARPADGGYQNGHAHSGLHESTGGRFGLAPPRLTGPARPH